MDNYFKYCTEKELHYVDYANTKTVKSKSIGNFVYCITNSKNEDIEYKELYGLTVSVVADNLIFIKEYIDESGFCEELIRKITSAYLDYKGFNSKEIDIKYDEYVSDCIVELMYEDVNSKKEENELLLANTMARIEELRTEIGVQYNRMRSLLNISITFNKEEVLKQITEEVNFIRNHDKTESVAVISTGFEIITKRIKLYEPVNDKYYRIDPVKIIINIRKNQVSIYAANGIGENAYWDNSPHPHISGSGFACFGNIEHQVSQYINEGELYSLYVLLISFLSTCDVNDPAGAEITVWDEIDENWTTIKEGYTRRRKYCELCEEYYDENEMVEMYDGELICNYCYEEHGYECANCGRRFYRENLLEHHTEQICSECYENLELEESERRECRVDISPRDELEEMLVETIRRNVL